MCDVCCKELKGWCTSFTQRERALTVIQAALLLFLVIILVLLILHLTICSTSYKTSEDSEQIDTEYTEVYSERPTKPIEDKDSTKKERPSTAQNTVAPDQECSWTPSAKTTALTHYYESHTTTMKHKLYEPIIEDFAQSDQSDGEDAETAQNNYVLVLVKLRPPQDVVFGCILTVISEYWVLTSASCIEAIEEVDSLDSFVIMEQYGTSTRGKIHSVFDLLVHPFYRGANRSYDLAALKSEGSLRNSLPVQLPTALDYSIITIGERFDILGFGAYRSIDKSPVGRSLRKVHVYTVPARLCGGAAADGALRHLEPALGLAPAPAACGAAPLCAGALYARGLPCNYCSGTPLLRGETLVGVMSDNQQCGVACEPHLYVNVALVRDWIHTVLRG